MISIPYKYTELDPAYQLAPYPHTWPFKIYVTNGTVDRELPGFREFTGPGGHAVCEYGYKLYKREIDEAQLQQDLATLDTPDAALELIELRRELHPHPGQTLIGAVKRLKSAAVPVCVGRPLIEILAKDGQWLSEEQGQGLVAADDLYKQNPYKIVDRWRAQLPELLHLRKLVRLAYMFALDHSVDFGLVACRTHAGMPRLTPAQQNQLGRDLAAAAQAPVCTCGATMIEHSSDGEWVCHQTHLL